MTPSISDRASVSASINSTADANTTPVSNMTTVTKPNKPPPRPPIPPPLPPRNQSSMNQINGSSSNHSLNIASTSSPNARCSIQQVSSINPCNFRQPHAVFPSKLHDHHEVVNNVNQSSACSHSSGPMIHSHAHVHTNATSLSDNGSCYHSVSSKCIGHQAASLSGHSSGYDACNLYCSSSDNGLEPINQIRFLGATNAHHTSVNCNNCSGLNGLNPTVRSSLFGDCTSVASNGSGCNEFRNHSYNNHNIRLHQNQHNIGLAHELSASSLSSLQQQIGHGNNFHKCCMSQFSANSSNTGVSNGDTDLKIENHLQAHNRLHNHCIDHHLVHTCGLQNQLQNQSQVLPSQSDPHFVSHHHCVFNDHMHRQLTPESISNRPCQNGLSGAATHMHNLSNSSTTTHASNVVLKHPTQFHRPTLSKVSRSNSHQFDQYGSSSAASNSSANASLSSYNAPVVLDHGNNGPLFLTNKMNQPLPPPPPKHLPPVPTPSANSCLHPPTLNASIISNKNIGIAHQSQPPLPPKINLPNQPTQITTIRTSTNSPITRVTSQAGVQSPLPASLDVPPPLPPLPSSRAQISENFSLTKYPMGSKEQINNNINNNIISNNVQVSSNNNMTNHITQRRPLPDPLLENSHTDDAQIHQFNHVLRLDSNNSPSMERKIEGFTKYDPSKSSQQTPIQTYGVCPACKLNVMSSQEACKALNQIFHASCFICWKCKKTLRGKTFYEVEDKVYCEADYKYSEFTPSVELCAACEQPITNMVIQALDRSYHPSCFKCCVCDKCLDGIKFTIDVGNNIYCIEDYHNHCSPKCAACKEAIKPIDNDSGETVRVVSMGKDYHVDCFCCQSCGRQLTDDESNRSYPLDNHLLCGKCHINKLAERKATLSLNG